MARDYDRKNGHSIKAVPARPMWQPNTRGGAEQYWSAVDAVIIRSLIDTVTRAGGAVMFSLTADGGAYSLCILQDDQKIKEYPHGPEDCEATQREIVRWYTEERL